MIIYCETVAELWFWQTADQPFMISDADREKLQSVEILVTYHHTFPRCNFEFTNLRWLQNVAAGNICSFHNFVTLISSVWIKSSANVILKWQRSEMTVLKWQWHTCYSICKWIANFKLTVNIRGVIKSVT